MVKTTDLGNATAPIRNQNPGKCAKEGALSCTTLFITDKAFSSA